MPSQVPEVKEIRELMENIFSDAEALFLNHYSRTNEGEGYGGAVIKPWTKDYRLGVIGYLKMMVELWRIRIEKERLALKLADLEYWKEKLKFDRLRYK